MVVAGLDILVNFLAESEIVIAPISTAEEDTIKVRELCVKFAVTSVIYRRYSPGAS